MNALKRNWKAIFALILLAAALGVFLLVYRPAKQQYESKTAELNIMITALQNTIAENLRYVDVQDKIPPATEEISASRLELYKKFPVEMKQEDQLMYVVYLEDTFGTEIQFPFSTGSTLCALPLTINYNTTYDGFKEMIDYLASDSRITSIQNATMNYDEENDIASGSLTLLCYTMKSELLEYTSPEVNTPETGKPNIFD